MPRTRKHKTAGTSGKNQALLRCETCQKNFNHDFRVCPFCGNSRLVDVETGEVRDAAVPPPIPEDRSFSARTRA